MKSSSLYIADTFPTVTDDDGIEHPMGGFVQVGTLPNGKVFLHAEPGRSPLPGMEVLLSDKGWKWVDLKDKFPQHANRVLQAAWDTGELDDEGRAIKRRGPIHKAQGKPMEQTDLPPHAWLGEKDR